MEVDPAKIEGKPAAAEDETQHASSRNAEGGSRQSRVGGDAAASGVRSGGGMTGASSTDGNSLDDEAAVGSIHHILKTAFKELYGGGAGEEEGQEGEGTEAAASRQGARAIGSAGSGSDSRRGSASAAATETEANTEGDGGSMGRGSMIDAFEYRLTSACTALQDAGLQP